VKEKKTHAPTPSPLKIFFKKKVKKKPCPLPPSKVRKSNKKFTKYKSNNNNNKKTQAPFSSIVK